MSLVKPVVFVSGNADKRKDANHILSPHIQLIMEDIDLLEIQGSEEDVAKEKCSLAMRKFKNSVVVIEDTSLQFDQFGGLPGPYIKHFNKKIGAEGLYRMLHCYDNKKATVISTVAIGIPANLTDSQKENIIIVNAKTEGEIVEPKGTNGDLNGWDPCFKPYGINLTLGEMDEGIKNQYCPRVIAFQRAVSIIKQFTVKTINNNNF